MDKLLKRDVQAILAFMFTAVYTIVTLLVLIMIWYMATNQTHFPDWANTLLSIVWGALTGKLKTIIDYYFGNSYIETPTTSTFEQTTSITKLEDNPSQSADTETN